MKISELYRMLCALYAIDSPIDIERYLVMADAAEAKITIGNRVPAREALLIRQDGDDIEMGLFLDPAITAALERGNPLDHLDELSCAIEGLSHFIYVADRAEKEMPVTKLELELQGEVDKFILIHLIASADSKCVSPELFLRQFEGHHFDSALNPDEIDRYATASHFAAKYCAHLRTTYFNPLRPLGLLSCARDFFERDFPSKIERLIP